MKTAYTLNFSLHNLSSFFGCFFSNICLDCVFCLTNPEAKVPTRRSREGSWWKKVYVWSATDFQNFPEFLNYRPLWYASAALKCECYSPHFAYYGNLGLHTSKNWIERDHLSICLFIVRTVAIFDRLKVFFAFFCTPDLC